MLSKEEIEKAYWKGYIAKQNEAMEICKQCKYIKKVKQLESDKQKLIDILEKENEEDTDTVKYYEKQRRITDSNFYKRCYQAQIHKANAMREVRKHVLEILKGENHDNQARIYRDYK